MRYVISDSLCIGHLPNIVRSVGVNVGQFDGLMARDVVVLSGGGDGGERVNQRKLCLVMGMVRSSVNQRKLCLEMGMVGNGVNQINFCVEMGIKITIMKNKISRLIILWIKKINLVMSQQ